MIVAFACLLAATDIDARFDAAQQAERAGDCTTAGEQYREVIALASSLPVKERADIEAQAHARLSRTAACRVSCEVPETDAQLFSVAKTSQANGEHKRVAELCAQLLRGKDTRCKGYAEMAAFCPKAQV